MHISHLLDTPADRLKAVRHRLRGVDQRFSASAAFVASFGITVWVAGAAAVLLRWVP